MIHPNAVLRFLSPTKATRLCSNYNTPYGAFVKQLFEFVLATPVVNAGVQLESAKNPATITLRYVKDRPPASLGIIPKHKELDQETEFLWHLHVRQSSSNVRVVRRGVFHAAASPLNQWHGDEKTYLTYAQALAEVMMDVLTFTLPPRQERYINGKLCRLFYSRHLGGRYLEVDE